MSAPDHASAWIASHLPSAELLLTSRQDPSDCAGPWLVDWACGHGRHSLLALDRGWRVLALDRDEEALRSLERRAQAAGGASALQTVSEDLEAVHPAGFWRQRLRDIACATAARSQAGWGIHKPGGDTRASNHQGIHKRGNHSGGIGASGIGASGIDAPGVGASGIRAPGIDTWGIDALVITRYLHRATWTTLASLLAPGGWFLHETFAQGHARYGRPTRDAFLLRPGELLALAQQAHLAILAFEDGTLLDAQGKGCARVQRLVARRPFPDGRADCWAGFALRGAH